MLEAPRSNFITLALPARFGVKLPKFVCAMGRNVHFEEFGDKFLALVPNVARGARLPQMQQ